MNTCGSVLEMQLLNIAENLDSRHNNNYSDSFFFCSDKSHNPLRKHDDHANNSSCKAHYSHLGQKRNRIERFSFLTCWLLQQADLSPVRDWLKKQWMNHALAHCNQQTLYLQIRCWARLCHLPNDSTTISVSTRQECACPGVIAS